ncbi:MAG TPA: VOC family protein [Myxococcota bacterium]|nr:VOC family protein [Myxococcota bacterium]
MSVEVRHFSALAPLLLVKDVDVSLSFYENVLGFTVLGRSADESGLTAHAEAVFTAGRVVPAQPQGPFMLMFARVGAWASPDKTWARHVEAGPRGRGFIQYVYVDDVDAFHDAVVAAGAKPCVPLTETDWGDRCFSVDDPDGFRWTFATNVRPFVEVLA